jgi:dCMP deaminase
MDLATRDLSGCIIFCTHFPCHECAKSIIQKGIITVAVDSNNFPGEMDNDFLTRWGESIIISKTMLEEAGIKIIKV